MSTEHTLLAGAPCPPMLDYLLRRRSVSAQKLQEPGPDPSEVQAILQAASRVPDHGKMFPWYFIIFEGENRAAASRLLREAYKSEDPEASEAKLDLEAERFLRAPLVIAVVSAFREGKHPLWEQILSAGAACQNLCLAANALGYATNWLTEWYSYNQNFRQALGLAETDHFAGFVYIGTPSDQPEERPRPDTKQIVTFWQDDATLNRGAEYGRPGSGFPRAGFRLPPSNS